MSNGISLKNSPRKIFTKKRFIMNIFQRGIETLRQPDRNPRCYELTDNERLTLIQWNNRNIWNTIELGQLDAISPSK
jgi:hypothetical protein